MMKTIDKSAKQKGGAIVSTVFIMAAIALTSSMMLLQTAEQSKKEQIRIEKKKAFELVVENLKKKLSNPHICTAAFKGKRLDRVYRTIDPITGALVSLLDIEEQTSNTPEFASLNSGVYIGGSSNRDGIMLPQFHRDPILPGLDPSLVRFESLRFNTENSRPSEIYANRQTASVTSDFGTFNRSGAGSGIPFNESRITRFKASINISTNIGLFNNDFYISNSANFKPGSIFSTEYQFHPPTGPSRKLYPVKVYRNGGVILRQIPKGNNQSGYVFHWTEPQLRQMGITAEKSNLEIPLYFYVGRNGFITDCFTENSAARTCELSGGIWRTANPPGYECEPRNKCLTSTVVYARTEAIATNACPSPFKQPLKVGVGMNNMANGTDPNRTSFLCRWCNTNRY